MFSAMPNYHLFLQAASFSNSTARVTLIEKNLKMLKEIDNLLKDATKYQNPDDLSSQTCREDFSDL